MKNNSICLSNTHSWGLLAVGLVGLAVACSATNPSPEDDTIDPSGDGDGDGTGGGDGDGDGDDTGGGDGDGDGNGGGGTGGSGLGGAGPGTGGGPPEPELAECEEDPNASKSGVGDCWDLKKCAASSPAHFLNQCGGAESCVGSFDNEERIKGYKGTLPSLRD